MNTQHVVEHIGYTFRQELVINEKRWVWLEYYEESRWRNEELMRMITDIARILIAITRIVSK